MRRAAIAVAVCVAMLRAVQVQAVSPVDGARGSCAVPSVALSEQQFSQVANPVFDSASQARAFGKTCERIAREIRSAGATDSECLELARKARLAAEFLKGDAVLLARSRAGSVVRLRDEVKIPPPEGFVYVRVYPSLRAMPREVATAFRPKGSRNGPRPSGVTIQGRYIAIIRPQYEAALEDTLSHELVHAYLVLASGNRLPWWFQEGAAVYYSTGTEASYYSKVGDPKIVKAELPEDYKRKLHTFQQLEERMGRKKFSAFVRRSVLTGEVDVKAALGIKPAPKPDPPPLWIVPAAVSAVLAAAGVGYLVQRRRRAWWDGF